MKLYNVCVTCLLAAVLLSCGAPEKSQEQKQEAQTVTQEEEQVAEDKKVILFFGNSITAGYGLDGSQAFPAVIQDIMDSLGYQYQVVNAGLSGETTAGGLNRIDWVLRTVPDVFVLELGANDGLRGLDLSQSKINLQAIVEKVKASNPNVVIFIAGMEVPPNLGQDYTTEFRTIFPSVAEATASELIPFILKDVAGEPELNQQDGIHPTAEGHRIVGKNVWAYLQPHLQQPAQ